MCGANSPNLCSGNPTDSLKRVQSDLEMRKTESGMRPEWKKTTMSESFFNFTAAIHVLQIRE